MRESTFVKQDSQGVRGSGYRGRNDWSKKEQKIPLQGSQTVEQHDRYESTVL